MQPSLDMLRQVRGVIFDCDGVLTPGDLYYDQSGNRFLRFHARDGVGMAALRGHIGVGVLSGRPVDIALRRFFELGVQHMMGGCGNKSLGVLQLATSLKLTPRQCAFVGDDLPDLAAFAQVGLKVAVADAAAAVKQQADWILQTPGGLGVVREVAEVLLSVQGIDMVAAYLPQKT